MNQVEQWDVIEHLKRVGGIFAAYQVTTFKAYRRDKAGVEREVTVEVWDAGPDSPRRYSVVATDEKGRQAGGNSHISLQAAIAMVHWWDLDKDPPA